MECGLVSPRPSPHRARRLRVGAALGALGLVAIFAGPVQAVPELPFWLRAARVSQQPGAGPVSDPARRASAIRLGLEQSQHGRYAAAAKAYGAAIASGAAEPAVYTNLAEVLMADGHLVEAEARYREAIALVSAAASGDPRALTQDLALASYGLAVALDRDEQPVAAREMMGRALALDPPTAVLKAATLANGDLFFVPEGEVFYYLGLAASVRGRRADAVEAFREFVTRAPGNRWVRVAERHIVELTTARPTVSEASAPRGPRLVASGTVLATGGLAAPLIDAAWRDQPALLDGCLETLADLPGDPHRAPIRFAVEIDVDGRGHLTSVTAKVPSPPGEPFARCVETAVKTGLRLRAPVPARPTRARTELIIGFAGSPGFPSGDGAGYR